MSELESKRLKLSRFLFWYVLQANHFADLAVVLSPLFVLQLEFDPFILGDLYLPLLRSQSKLIHLGFQLISSWEMLQARVDERIVEALRYDDIFLSDDHFSFLRCWSVRGDQHWYV